MSVVAVIIQIIHILVICFVLYGPWLKDLMFMLLYLVIIFGMAIHWIANDNSCLLTQLESMARGIPLENGFIYRVLTPLFKIEHLDLSKIIYIVTLTLWLIVLYKVIKSPQWKHLKFRYKRNKI